MEFQQNTLHQYLPEWEGENFEVIHVHRNEEQVRMDKIRALFSGSYEYAYQQPGTITVLRDKKGNIIMSDSGMEWNTNREFVRRANGNVLIAGLGLGWIVMVIQDKPEVDYITVVEKEKEIIEYCKSHWDFYDKVHIACSDIFAYNPDGRKWDTIYFDIWSEVTADNHEQMKTLHRRFGRKVNRINPNCFISSWRKHDVYRMAAEERNSNFYY